MGSKHSESQLLIQMRSRFDMFLYFCEFQTNKGWTEFTMIESLET